LFQCIEFFRFGDEYRPCKLNVSVIGFKNTSSNPFLFENNLNYKLAPLIHENNDGKPTLIFCSTRKAASSTALHLSKECGTTGKSFVLNQQQQRRLSEASRKTTDKSLQSCIVNGIGYHSAGMCNIHSN
jgi:ATP-dependent DNA helicase HFM1/MER3